MTLFQIETNVGPVDVNLLTMRGREDVFRNNGTAQWTNASVEFQKNPFTLKTLWNKENSFTCRDPCASKGLRAMFTLKENVRGLDAVTIMGNFRYAGSVGSLRIGLRTRSMKKTVWRVTGEGFDFRLSGLRDTPIPAGEIQNAVLPVKQLQGSFPANEPIWPYIEVNGGTSAVVGDGSTISFEVQGFEQKRIESMVSEQQNIGLTTEGSTAISTIMALPEAMPTGQPTPSISVLSQPLIPAVLIGGALLFFLATRRKKK